MKTRKKFCQFATSVICAVASASLFGLSFKAALHFSGADGAFWNWLAWFSGVTFVGGFVMALFTIAAGAVFFSDLCGGDR